MNGRPLTDAQIARALRVHLPESAQAGLRERVFEAVESTSQQRALPSFLGGLSDADPVGRRRSLLIAAALLVALALASAAAVGAWRLLQRDPVRELSLEPPADLPAFVLSSYERLPQLPPVALAWHDSGSAKGRIYVDRSGTVRFDRFASADATEPSSSTIVRGKRISGMAFVDSEAVWIEEGHEAIEDDPRVFLRTVFSRPGGGPGCEMEQDPSEVDGRTAATGWRYVDAEYVAGRPTHHVACVGELSLDIDLWLDIETRLILRTRAPATDESGQPIPGQFETTEVTEIAFGDQPAALFEAPQGVTRMSEEAYLAYLCTRDLADEEVVGLGAREECLASPEAQPTPLPTATPMPTEHPSVGPRPSGPAGPLAWSKASLKEDWPAPVRPEPAGGSSVLAMPLTHFDPTGDTGSDIDPWVDIRAVTGDTSTVHLKLVSNQPPVVNPTEQWIAYGVVIDDDRDGVPDWRYGIDNKPDASGEPLDGPGEASPQNRTRVWRTHLHTGRTDDVGLGDERWHGVWPDRSDASFIFGGAMDIAGKGTVEWGIELDMPFYTWASVIVNGRVVATDYAPNAGWLIATPGAKPGGTHLLEDPFPVRLSMTVPDGWTVEGPHLRDWREEDTGIELSIVDDPRDPCPDTTGPPLGPSFDDLVTYVARLPMINISEKSEVTVDGYRGTYLEYTITDHDVECYGGPVPMGEHNYVWIVDVDGARLVIAAFSTSASETGRPELSQIVESIQIEP
jgi:hypothetical protein